MDTSNPKKINEYCKEIRDYLLARLVKKHLTDDFGGIIFDTSEAPILPWWIFEGSKYKGYTEPLYKIWDQIYRQIDLLLSTYNPKWQGITIPEGEVDWIATAFATVTSFSPEYICRTSKIGLSIDEKNVLFGWMGWLSGLWDKYLNDLKLDYSPQKIFDEHLDPSNIISNVAYLDLIKWATIAKRSRWPLFRNVIAESLRPTFEPVIIDKLPLPESQSAIFELLCMVRILRTINKNPSAICWVDNYIGNNKCRIHEGIYHYQHQFDPLYSLDFSENLSEATKWQNVKVPEYADGYFEFTIPYNGFSGILIEAKSSKKDNERELGDTIYQLKSLLSAIRKERKSGKYLILGIVDNIKKDNNLNEYLKYILEPKENMSNDIWCFISADEIEKTVSAIIFDKPFYQFSNQNKFKHSFHF